MAYKDFITAFAKSQGITTGRGVEERLQQKHRYVLNVRDVAKPTVTALLEVLPRQLENFRVLHIGCGYGSLLIELAARGASVVGVDNSDAKIDLAKIHASGEVEATFFKSYVNVKSHADNVRRHGPFNLILVDDLFQRVYETVKLIRFIKSIAAVDAFLNCRILNASATQVVLSDPGAKKAGVVLLPPDQVAAYVGGGQGYYYHPREHYDALFDYFGFKLVRSLVRPSDPNHDHTKKQILEDLDRIRDAVEKQDYPNEKVQSNFRAAFRDYSDDVRADLKNLNWDQLYEKYRATYSDSIRRL